MHEQSAGVPMILRGPEVPAGRVIDTPVSLVDCQPTVLECLGSATDSSARDLPGHSLFDIANGATPARNVISEFHDGGSPCGYTMVRVRNWKYIYYVDYAPQLFDLDSDPNEDIDRASDTSCRDVLFECESRLRDMLDPEAVNAMAFADQADALGRLGGREAVMQRDDFDFGFTPVETMLDRPSGRSD